MFEDPTPYRDGGRHRIYGEPGPPPGRESPRSLRRGGQDRETRLGRQRDQGGRGSAGRGGGRRPAPLRAGWYAPARLERPYLAGGYLPSRRRHQGTLASLSGRSTPV